MNTNPNLKITLTLQEIKPLVIENIDNAQNVNSELFIPRLKSYTELHYPLIKFYKKYKKNKPTMADKLCFVILLSYPKNIIESLDDISDIKLFSHDNTDFNYNDELTLNHEEDENERYDCICSYEKLQKVHIVENKYSGIVNGLFCGSSQSSEVHVSTLPSKIASILTASQSRLGKYK